MSAAVLNALSVSFGLLLLGSIALSAYLFYDMKSGNYRKLLPGGEQQDGFADGAHKISTQNLGEEA
jgi:hypothetical protein